jgi:aminopeptidase N
MPTYLVALFIGEMDRLEDSVDGVRLGIYTAKGRSARGRFAMEATKQVLRYLNEYFDTPYALPKLDQIALPGGLGGAMENWGAIAYNEARLLVDPADAPLSHRQGVYAIVAHEISHQWFGNLVTMAWWDNLWLNEGFAQWMQTKAAERFHPEWNTRLRSGLFRQVAMSDDARRTAHPIQTPVESDARAMDLFNPITYAKGAAFVGMLESYLGEAAFRDGLRRYMKAHAFSNATTADLWHHLSAASGRDVAALAAPWTEQPGFPLVTLTQRCDGGRAVVTLAQERFTLNDPAALRLMWRVPVTLAAADGRQRTVLLERAPQTLEVGPCGVVLANAGSVGYFRVHYDEGSFERIADSLAKLPAPERFRLLTDTLALVQAGRAGAERYLGLVERLGAEREATIWEHVIGALRFLRDLVDPREAQAAFDRRIVALLRPAFARVGWDATPGEAADIAPLRGALIAALGRAGDTEVIAEARARFEGRAAKPLRGRLRSVVLNVVGRHADAATFEALLAELRGAAEIGRRWELQGALRQAADPALTRRWLEHALKADELPPGDAVFNLQRTGGESGNFELGWEFVRANLDAIYAKASPRGRVHVLPDAAAPFADGRIAEELLALTRERLGPDALHHAEKTADWIRLRAALRAREGARLARWAAGG